MKRFRYLLVILLLLVPLRQARATSPYDAINANPPLRRAILAYYDLADREMDAEICSDIKARNAASRDFAMDLGEEQGISSFSGIGILESLGVTELYVSGLHVASGWEGIASISGLRLLEAEGCGLTSLPNLGGLAGLQSLRLRNNSITSIAGIIGCKALTELDISANPLTDLSPLAGVSGLQKLVLGGGRVSGWGFLSGKTGLEELSIQDAGFTDADWQSLSGLNALQQLTLTGNDISTAEPLKQMKEAGSLAGLQVASLEHNYIGQWAAALPASLSGIQLTPASARQYAPAVLLGGVPVDSVHISKDTTLTVAKRIIGGGNTAGTQPAEVSSSSANVAVSASGGSVLLSPRINGSAVLSLRLIDGAANTENVSLSIPVSIQGGDKSASLQLTAGGKSVYHSFDGLFAGAEVELQAPSRDECKRMFQAVGVDLDDYDMPEPGTALVAAGQSAGLVFPKISTGTVTLRHILANGDELAAETLSGLSAGGYTYHPRGDIPGYIPMSPAQTVRINHYSRNPQITFRYQYDPQKAARNKAGTDGMQGGVYSPALPFELKGESRAVSSLIFGRHKNASCCPTDFEYAGSVTLRRGEGFAPEAEGRIYLSDLRTARVWPSGIEAMRRGTADMFVVKPCSHVTHYDITVV